MMHFLDSLKHPRNPLNPNEFPCFLNIAQWNFLAQHFRNLQNDKPSRDGPDGKHTQATAGGHTWSPKSPRTNTRHAKRGDKIRVTYGVDSSEWNHSRTTARARSSISF